MTFYERIETLRKQRNISQGNLEKELGFSNGSISKWKNSSPTPERLKKLADYFNVSVEYLLTGKEKEGGEEYYLNEETKEIAQEIFENPDLKSLFDMSRKMSPERLKAHIEFMKNLQKTESDT
jgi:transcriptional regulator with XRE-family HTH domain|nr:MAG TPA: repressor protein [Caudoviricetes sp.]